MTINDPKSASDNIVGLQIEGKKTETRIATRGGRPDIIALCREIEGALEQNLLREGSGTKKSSSLSFFCL